MSKAHWGSGKKREKNVKFFIVKSFLLIDVKYHWNIYNNLNYSGVNKLSREKKAEEERKKHYQ